MNSMEKTVNKTTIPKYELEALARCFLPDIINFFESEEGQREYEEWRQQRETEKQQEGQTE